MKLLITGSNGQLGSELKYLSPDYPAFDYFFTGREELDICSKDADRKIMLESIV